MITFSMGDPGSDQWILYYHARYRGNLATAQTAIGAPKYYQYLQTGQLVGLIGGHEGRRRVRETGQEAGPRDQRAWALSRSPTC